MKPLIYAHNDTPAAIAERVCDICSKIHESEKRSREQDIGNCLIDVGNRLIDLAGGRSNALLHVETVIYDSDAGTLTVNGWRDESESTRQRLASMLAETLEDLATVEKLEIGNTDATLILKLK